MSKIAFVFPGQGAQYVGMGRELYEEHVIAKELFHQANEVLGFDLMNLCFEGSIEELTKTENAQAAILTHSVAAFQVFTQEHKVEPSYLLGHSLGEITALTCAGAIAFKDAVKLVYQRGRLMQDAVAEGVGAMASIQKVDKAIVQQLCQQACVDGKIAVISNYNSPNQVVISGHSEAFVAISEILKNEYEGFVVPLKVSAPFHSPLMNEAVPKFRAELSTYTFHDLKYPVISNVTGLPYESRDVIIENLSNQIVSAVQWQHSVHYIEANGVTTAFEFGPKKVLKNLIKSCTPTIQAYSYDSKEERDLMAQELLTLQAKEIALYPYNLLALIDRCLAVAICTKNNNPSQEEYEIGVLKPYREVKLKQSVHEQEEGRNLTIHDVNEAIHMLQSVFTTKRTPLSERAFRFTNIQQEARVRGVALEIKEQIV